jgi:hypothetical protein
MVLKPGFLAWAAFSISNMDILRKSFQLGEPFGKGARVIDPQFQAKASASWRLWSRDPIGGWRELELGWIGNIHLPLELRQRRFNSQNTMRLRGRYVHGAEIVR